jgi:signal transduction histidine kinase
MEAFMPQDGHVMSSTREQPANVGGPPSGFALRMRLLGWSTVLPLFSMLGLAFYCFWITSFSLIVVVLGIPGTLLGTVLVRWFANLHRVWAGNILGEVIERPYRQAPDGGMGRRLRRIITDPASWRDWTWLLVNASAGFTLMFLSFSLFIGGIFYLIYPFLWSVTPPDVFGNPFGFVHLNHLSDSFAIMPLGLLCFVLWWTTALPLATATARLDRWLLAPTDASRLGARVEQLASSRAETVDTQAAELRRIERDLHDGAQARLVSLGMSLGLAEELMARDPAGARRLLSEARESTTTALSELRDLVRGIHPPVLADRGLDGAVHALALANPIPTNVTINLPGRLTAPVESAAYFAVAECLANAIKHAGARAITVEVGYAAGWLAMRVCDDGRGGADPATGTGLRGIERRLAAFDGTISVASPPEAGTDVRMSLPCELSSPKISPSSATG